MEKDVCSYQKYIKGDNSGLEEIVTMYSDSLYLFINSIIKNSSISEDVLSDTFLVLIIKKPKIKESKFFKTYLFKIAKNKSLDYLRKNSKTLPLKIDI